MKGAGPYSDPIRFLEFRAREIPGGADFEETKFDVSLNIHIVIYLRFIINDIVIVIVKYAQKHKGQIAKFNNNKETG